MRVDAQHPRCFECGSEDLVYDRRSDALLCRCGAANLADRYVPELADCFCGECGRPMEAVSENEKRHVDDLDVPKCSVHRAEVALERRRRLRVIPGGRA